MRFFQKPLLVLLLILPLSFAHAEKIFSENTVPKVGDVVVVNSPSSEHFQHIYFPEPDAIQKKTGSLNYKQVFGIEARITKVESRGNGVFVVTLKPLYEKKFFGHWRTVQANYSQAMDSGELNISY
jgi:hypothetical protein